ncbi:late endosomal/lysosomal adaptor, MAPK and MTOR activator 1 [Haemaphysalis longicornis]
MGCCFSCNEDKRSQGEPSENSRLLANPVGNASQHSFHDSYGGIQSGSVHLAKGDDQNALNRIIHQTAANVIDVSALDSQLEQHEYLNRGRQYSQRVSLLALPAAGAPCLLDSGGAPPQEVLARPPLAPAHLHRVDALIERVQQVLADVQVEHKEDLVVQLCSPP